METTTTLAPLRERISELALVFMHPTRVVDAKYHSEDFFLRNCIIVGSYARDKRTKQMKAENFRVYVGRKNSKEGSTGWRAVREDNYVDCGSDARMAAALVLGFDDGVACAKLGGGL